MKLLKWLFDGKISLKAVVLIPKAELCFCDTVWWMASQVTLAVKNPPISAGDMGDTGLTPGSGRSPEEVVAAQSSILAWRIPWTEEPGGLYSIGSQSQTWLKQLSTNA